MTPSVTDLSKLQAELIKTVDIFPAEKREQILFDKWSLKDVLAHIAGWDEIAVNAINNFKIGKPSIWGKSVDETNQDNTNLRKNKLWEEIYAEFVTNSQKLIDAYSTIPDNLWDQPLYPDKKFSPAKFLKIDIDHYQEHLESITKLL